MSKKLVLFVDGPTGSGKDYFIEHMYAKLLREHPELNVSVVRAVDFTLKGEAKSEDRKYVTYNTETEKLEGIFRGHIDLLKFLEDALDSTENVVLVNRSILSFLIYNCSKSKDPLEEDNEVIDGYVKRYKEAIRDTLGNVEVAMIRIGIQSEDAAFQLRNRILGRNDGKELDFEWIKWLNDSYTYVSDNILTMFPYAEYIESDEIDEIISKYITDEDKEDRNIPTNDEYVKPSEER